MFEKRPKFIFFTIGLFIGGLLGGILVYYNSVITNENKISVNLIPQIVKQIVYATNTNKNTLNENTLSKDTSKSTPATKLPLSSNYASETTTLPKSTIAPDSSIYDSLNTIPINENITLKKEEQIGEKQLSVINLDNEHPVKVEKSDSLLAVISDTKIDNKKGSSLKINVELWKSPINYKGYQASKNKIILYGLTDLENIKIFTYKNELLLKYNETVYNIDYNSSFSSYEKVKDNNLISLILNHNP